MERWLGSVIFAMLFTVSSFAGPRPQVLKSGQTVSINVENMTLGRLLELWDQATGMRSSVPKELATRTVSISFSGLPVNDAVQKIFEKLPLDYVFIESQGIIVTAASQTAAIAESLPVDEEALQAAGQQPEQEPQQPPQRTEPAPPPPMIFTPFGLIPRSNTNSVIQLPPVWGEAPGPPFFAQTRPVTPPAGAANGPVYNDLFAPISIYQNPSLPSLTSQPR
jgi:hypothetical protein